MGNGAPIRTFTRDAGVPKGRHRMNEDRTVVYVAMSGVRIYDAELTALGMTLPGFIERGKVIASLPSLGLLTLAGNAPENWSPVYIEIDAFAEDSAQLILQQQPDLVAISSLSARVNDAYKLAAQIKEAGIPVVIGGLHASAMPEEAEMYADVVVVGQGERLWREVLSDFENGSLKHRYVESRKPLLENLNQPAYELLNPDKYNRIPLQTTRGCPLDCQFCGASRLISNYGRKPLAQIEQELDSITSIWPKPFIELADDNTFVNKEWGLQLVKLIGKFGAKWFTETDITFADDDRLLEASAEAGCAQVLIGFESIDESSLRETDQRNWKANQRKRYVEAIEKIQSKGISVNGCFVFGFDSDRESVFETTADFVQESGLTEVQVTILTPFPGTRLYKNLRNQRRLLKENFWDECTLFDVTFRPKNMSVAELRAGFRELVGKLYSECASHERKARQIGITRNRLQGAKN